MTDEQRPTGPAGANTDETTATAAATTAPTRDVDSLALALRVSEERFRRIVDALPMGVHMYRLESDGRLVFAGANPAADAMLGVDNSQFVGLTLEQAFPPLAGSEIPRRYREVCATGELFRTEQVDYEDERIRGAFDVYAFRTGPHAMVALFQDVTARRRDEEAMRYRLRFEKLVSDVSARLVDVAASEVGAQVERALAELAAFSGASGAYLFERSRAKETVTATATWQSAGLRLDVLRGRNIALADLSVWSERFARGEAVVVPDVAALGPESSVVLALALAAGAGAFVDVPLLEGDRMVGFIGLASARPRRWSDDDVALLQMVGQVLTHALRRLRTEHEMAALQEQLIQAQKMEAIGRLAGGVAHDFNNLLTGIMGYAEVALAMLGPETPVAGHVREILRASERAASLTSQLLAFSRKQAASPAVIRLEEVVADSRRMLERLLGERVELRVESPPGLWAVEVDPAQVDQVLVNLATNARDAMPEGGTITIACRNEVGTADEGGGAPVEHVVLAVTDTGSGMDAETQIRAFEPFFTTKARGKGTGLGLSTVYGIVRQNRGRVDVLSRPGSGTTVEIRLPRSHEEPRAPEPGKLSAARRGGGETVLVVEDDQAVRSLVRDILRDGGYRVVEAATGEEALDVTRRLAAPVDLVLTDVVMPGLNGRALRDRLAASDPGLRTVFMSGYADDVIADHGVLEAGTDYLQKPFTAKKLLATVRAVLDRGPRRAVTSAKETSSSSPPDAAGTS